MTTLGRSTNQGGFTLIELLMAMAVFSFMLSIIVAGFLNVVRLHNSSVSTNVVMDNAQTIMSTLERDIRDGTRIDATRLAAGELCVDDNQLIYVDINKNLMMVPSANCTPAGTPVQLSSSDVKIYYFALQNDTPATTRPTIHLAMVVGTANATMTGSGLATSCTGNAEARAWCAITTVTGAATPRAMDGGTP